MLISDLENSIMRGRPVIVQIQAWGDEGTDYTNDFDDGHYVVAIGFDENYLYFEDPWIIGNIAYIPKK
jgi:predicted double-glycine peptidase